MSKGGSEKELVGGMDISWAGDLERLGLGRTVDSKEGADGSGSCTMFSSKIGDGARSRVGDPEMIPGVLGATVHESRVRVVRPRGSNLLQAWTGLGCNPRCRGVQRSWRTGGRS